MKKIKLQNIRPLVYHIRHHYFTLNNAVIAVAFIIAAGWVWGSLTAMQRNYTLQKQVDYQQQQLELTKLQVENLQLEQQYYQTPEYLQQAARQSLGLALPGEKLLILPPNSQQAIAEDTTTSAATATTNTQNTSNFEQWINFLFGGYSKSMNQ